MLDALDLRRGVAQPIAPPNVEIDIDSESELLDYSIYWDVSPHRIRRAVEMVGPRCVDVERLLKAR